MIEKELRSSDFVVKSLNRDSYDLIKVQITLT